MRLQDDIDFTTLTWVKSELDETLKQARNALEAYVEDPTDASQMRFCATYLHQVQGTLRMVELYGAAMVTEEMEHLASSLQNNEVGDRDDAYTVLMRGIVQLPDYLERLQSGHKDIPIVLLPLLNELRAARGEKGLSESVLFSPDLSRPLPDTAAGPSGPMPELELRQMAGQLRSQFQMSLLKWFRNDDPDANLQRMTAVCDRLVALTFQEEGRRVFWVASGVLDALRQHKIDASAPLKQTVGRVEREIKRLAESGEGSFRVDPPRELTRNLLYFVAHAESRDGRMGEMRQVFRLDSLLPTEEEIAHARGSISGHNRALLDTVATAIKEDLMRVKDALDLFLRSQSAKPGDLGSQVDVLDRVADTLGMLGLGVPRRVVQEQRDMVRQVANGEHAADESTLLDIAGALLYVEATLDDQVQQLGSGGEPVAGAKMLPQAEARRVLEAVVKEAQTNFAQAKQCFVAFVESSWDHAQLNDVPRLLDEVAGAMRILEVASAAELLTGVRVFTEQELVRLRRVPNGEQMDTLADALASLEYFLEALRDHRAGRDKILEVARQSLASLGYWPVPSREELAAAAPVAPTPVTAAPSQPVGETVAPNDDADAAAATVPETGSSETDSGRSVPAPAVDVEPVEEHPELTAYDLPTFDMESSEQPAEADLSDLSAVEVAPGRNLEDLVVGETASEPVQPRPPAHDVSGFRPVETERTAPPSQLLPLVHGFESTDDEIDEEIRDVFVEEVEEEIANLGALLPLWYQAPDDLERVKPIRRVFHTLKGSGRLVGARSLGEFSWRVENMLNRVLDNTVPPRREVLDYVQLVFGTLPVLLSALRGATDARADLEGIASVADQLAAGEAATYRPPQDEAASIIDIDLDVDLDASADAGDDALANEVDTWFDAAQDAQNRDAEATSEVADMDSAELSGTDAESTLRAELGAAAPSIDPVLFDILKAEVAGHLETVDAYLDASRQTPQPVTDPLLRAVHTMNGAFAMTDVPLITEVISPLEGYIKRLLAQGAAPDSNGLELLRQSADAVREMVVALEQARPVLPDYSTLARQIVGLRDALPEPKGPSVPMYLDDEDDGEFDLDIEIEQARDRTPSDASSVTADGSGIDGVDEVTAGVSADVFALTDREPGTAGSGEQDPGSDAAAVEVEELSEEEMAALLAGMVTDADTSKDEVLEQPASTGAGQGDISEFGELSFDSELDTASEEELEGADPESFAFEVPETEGRPIHAYWQETENAAPTPAAGEGQGAATEQTEQEMLEWMAGFEADVAADAGREDGAGSAELEGPGPELPDPAWLENSELAAFGNVDSAVDAAAPDAFAEARGRTVEDAGASADRIEEPVEWSELVAVSEADAEQARGFDEQGWEIDDQVPAEQPVAADPERLEAANAGSADDQVQAEDAAELPVWDARQSTGDDADLPTISEFEDDARAGSDDPVTVDAEAASTADFTAAPADIVEPEVTAELGASPEPMPAQPAAASGRGKSRLAFLDDPEADGPLDVSDVDEELLDIFLEEGHDILDHSDGLLAQLREAPSDRETVVGLQRDLHTLKGGARMAGLAPIGDLSHVMESLLEAVAEGGRELHGFGVEILESGFDRLHGMVTRVGERRAIAMPVKLIEGVEALLRGEQPGAAEAAAEPEQSEVEAGPVAERTALAPLPPLRPVTAESTALDEEDTGVRAPQEQIRIRADLLDRLVNYAGEVAIYRARLEQQLGSFRGNLGELDQTTSRLRDQLRKLEIETEAQIVARYQRQAEEGEAAFDPLELDRFSTLQQLSRALSESAADIVNLQHTLEDLTRQYETLLLQQSRVSSDLQEGLMRTRMVPFDALVPRLRRIIRQTAGELGKKAQLKVEGAQGEMDRNVLDRMTAPLEHMLRNALAHGLELPAERTAAGKPEEGSVRINVSREASEVVIRVGDDGRGLDRDAIRAKAIERGLMKPDVQLTDRDLYGFILEAGFSTAQSVSKIAGRGVGMDVVHSEIRQLGGSLHIESERGKGTEFVVRLPFTLAVTQAVFVKLHETSFAVPITSVQGVARIDREDLDKQIATGKPVYRYAGEDYLIYDLGLLLGQQAARAADSLQVPLLLARSGDQRAAICVDAVIGSREIVVKPTGPQVSSIPGIFGATMMGDGRVIIILDVAPLVRRAAATDVAAPQQALPVEEARPVPLVMVVDDSITMRKVTGRVLERHNFEVLTAKDGVDAIEKLSERVPDVMLLDIEMPRMDGYELATHMRNDPRLKRVPIIMITSRTGDKHRQRAFEIGVDRYLGKPYQESDLMRNVQEILQVERDRGR